jgi:hypothetical protein
MSELRRTKSQLDGERRKRKRGDERRRECKDRLHKAMEDVEGLRSKIGACFLLGLRLDGALTCPPG